MAIPVSIAWTTIKYAEGGCLTDHLNATLKQMSGNGFGNASLV
jgi:hypothetical protein